MMFLSEPDIGQNQLFSACQISQMESVVKLIFPVTRLLIWLDW